jgi:ribosome-binding factor A
MDEQQPLAPRERPRRAERLADLIRQELAVMLERDVKDPRIGFVTVTYVDLSGDLRTARVSVSIMGDELKKQQGMQGLTAAKNFLRYQLGQRLRLRHTPAIEFHLDRSQEYDERLEELIRRSKQKKSEQKSGDKSQETE